MIIHYIWVAFILSILLSTHQAASCETEPLRVLLITGGTPIRYHKDLVPTSLYSIFGEQNNFVWDHVSLDEAAFEKDVRDSYDVIVFFHRCDSLSKIAEKHLKAFVESGKGLVLLHSALSSYNEWDWWWREVVGGKYQMKVSKSSPKSGYKQNIKLSFEAVADHPITKAVGNFALVDEAYNGLSISSDVQILYRTDHPDSDGPIVWIGPHRKSRVVVIQPGHFASTYLHSGFRSLLYNSILWAGDRKIEIKQEQKEHYKMDKTNIESLKNVIEEAYINGIHKTQDEKTAKKGFHHDFAMLVQDNGNLKKVTVDEWLAFIENTAKVENPKLWNSETTFSFDTIDITDNIAFVKIEVYKGSKQFSTDYFLLYKFDEKWKIVSKIFKLYK
jgi:type 1 glutamine amidotransferase